MAKTCQWASAKDELMLCVRYHFSCADQISQLLKSSDGLKQDERVLGQHSMVKHREWGALLQKISQLDVWA